MRKSVCESILFFMEKLFFMENVATARYHWGIDNVFDCAAMFLWITDEKKYIAKVLAVLGKTVF